MDYKNRVIELPQNRVWRSYQGGLLLDKLAGKSEPQDSHYPEDWIGSVTAARNPDSQDENEGISAVRVDERELSLPDLIAMDPEYFLGAEHVARFGRQPMVLVKFLDSAVRLQLQAHPTAEFAQQYLDANSGKAEAYYILSAREDIKQPYVYLGFQRPPARDDFQRWIEQQDMESILSCFDKIPVKPGDVLFIPGGVPHAIGAGIFMVEIMEPSDLVVRFEFERAGYTLPESARFMNRGLRFCMDIFDFEPMPKSRVERESILDPKLKESYGETGSRYELVGPQTTSRFRVNKSEVHGVVEREDASFFIGVVTKGRCVLKTSGAAIELEQFSKFFCPAGLGSYCIEADDGVQILECLPPTPSRAFVTT